MGFISEIQIRVLFLVFMFGIRVCGSCLGFRFWIQVGLEVWGSGLVSG